MIAFPGRIHITHLAPAQIVGVGASRRHNVVGSIWSRDYLEERSVLDLQPVFVYEEARSLVQTCVDDLLATMYAFRKTRRVGERWTALAG